MRILKYAALAAVIGLAACSTTGGSSGGTDIQPTVFSIGGKFAFALNGVNGLGFPIPAQFCGPIKAFDTLYLAAEKIAITGNGDSAAVIQNLETAAAAALAAAVEAGFTAHPPLFAVAANLVGDPTPAQWATQDAAIAAGMAGLRCL